MSRCWKRLRKAGGWWLLGLVVLTGCATRPGPPAAGRPFQFGRDTFAYRNDLVWEYVFNDADGTMTHRTKEVAPDYTHHCFVVARSARQFFQFARFDPARPKADDATCRRLVREVTGRDPQRTLPDERRVLIPGFTNLHHFSTERAKLLQEECGGAWRSYFQRGHWRMVLPFRRAGQEREARWLMQNVANHRPPVVHIAKFPQLTINHALVLIEARETEQGIEFLAYDPYEIGRPVPLVFDKRTRWFHYGRNPYFVGGRVNVYEIYRAWCF